MTLRTRLDVGSNMAVDDSLACIRQVLDGLCELHKHRVVHLHIQPESVFRCINAENGDQVRECRRPLSHFCV